jgi:hypothetical protein
LWTDGITTKSGMSITVESTPMRANNSDTRERGRLQWLLVNRKATAAKGAAPVTMKMNEKIAA